MLKNKPIIIFITILIAVLFIAISVVVSIYNINKPVVPDNSIKVMSSSDKIKIKTAYEQQGRKEDFLNMCEKIELAVANKILDGTVTTDKELVEAIKKINEVLKSEDWTYLGIEPSNFWMGVWSLDAKGAVKFKFQDSNIEPNWTQDEQVKEKIIH